jgi:hypothetical protein
MNVENRKLFRNKDARARLAGMGGIIASSPELLGTVQKFQDAGPVVPSTFLVQLPGLIGGNEFLQLTAAELQLLNEKQPGLMSSEGVMIQEATPEILSNLNPAQYNTTNNPNIKRMFADLGVTLPESSVEAEGPSFLDTIKSYLAPSGESSGSSALDELRAAQNKIATTEGVLGPRVATETLGFMDSDAGQKISPEMARELEILEQARDAQEFAGGFAESAKDFGKGGLETLNIAGGTLGSGTAGLLARGLDAAGYVTGAYPNVSKPLFRLSDKMDEFKKNYYGSLVGQDNYFPRMYTSPEIPVSEAELLSQEAAAKQEAIAKQSLAALENADPSVFAEGAPTELTPSAKAAASVTRMSEQGMPKGLSAEAIERIQSQITADKEMDAAGQRLIAGQPREVGPVEVNPQPVDDRNLLEKGIDLVKKGIDKYKVDRASEDAAKSLEDLKTTALEFGPGDLTPEKVAEINKQIQTEKENTIIAEEVKPGDVEEAMKLAEPSDGSVTSTGSGDGKDKPTTTSSLYADYKKEILTALGGEKKDKNKEKWEDFSLAMFRIAAGKDPSAVANIAAGLAQSAADKKTDRSVQQERDDRINMLALKMSQEEKLAKIRASKTGTSYDAVRERSRLKEIIYNNPYDYPNLLGSDGTIDPTKVNKYLDVAVSTDSTTPVNAPITEESARKDAARVLKARPELREVVLKRLTDKGFNIEGL